MSDEKNSTTENGVQDRKIEEFAKQQLEKTRTGLHVTRIITIIVAALAVFYLYVYSQLKPWLDPNHLSNEALLLVQTHVNENARDLSNRLLSEYPHVLTNGISKLRSQVPSQYTDDAEKVELWLNRMAQPGSDMAQKLIDEMPSYRENVEKKIRRTMLEHTERALGELSLEMDDLLDKNKKLVLKIMENNKDQESLVTLSAEMETTLKNIILEREFDNENIHEKLHKSVGFLDRISKQMAYLAKNQNLSDDERRTRRAIAVILDKIEYVRPVTPETVIDINSKKDPKQPAPPTVPGEQEKPAPKTPTPKVKEKPAPKKLKTQNPPEPKKPVTPAPKKKPAPAKPKED